MTDADWLRRLPVIGQLPADDAADKLREIGDDELADQLAGATVPGARSGARTYGLLPTPGSSRRGAFLHTAHTIGYLAPATGETGLLPLCHAASITPDSTLDGARIKVTLDGLRVADYPGRGAHRILLSLAARNQTSRGPEQLHFNLTCRVADGERAAILGRPVFTGLRVGGEGIFLQCATVNVLNESDEKLLHLLDSDAFQAGLQLLTTLQPALAPFSALALGLTQAIAARTRNVPVQAIDLGLDFSSIAPRPRLAEGSYIAVQIPESRRLEWRWEDWGYDAAASQLVSCQDPAALIPYNYLIIGISRYREKAGNHG
jgi:hypothetical protein